MNLFVIFIHCLIVFSMVRYTVGRCLDESLRFHGWVSAILKLSAGLALGLVYKYYYLAGDTFVFHDEALTLIEAAKQNPGAYINYMFGWGELPVSTEYSRMPRVLFQVKILSLVHLLTGGNYWTSSLYFSLFSWLGMWSLASKISRNYPSVTNSALLACLYFPSFIFWSSGITKESIAVGALGFILTFFVPNSPVNFKGISFLIMMILLMWLVKYFYVVPLAMALTLPPVWNAMEKKSFKWPAKLAVIPVIGLVLFGLVSFLNPNFNWDYFPEMVYFNYEAFAAKSDPGTFADYSSMCGKWICLIRNFPEAALTALYRPFLWESRNIFQFLAGAENLLLFLLLLRFLMRLGEVRTYSPSTQGWLLSGILFIVVLCGFLGLATPNFGTLQRYASICIPEYLFVFTAGDSVFNSKIFPIRRTFAPWINQ